MDVSKCYKLTSEICHLLVILRYAQQLIIRGKIFVVQTIQLIGNDAADFRLNFHLDFHWRSQKVTQNEFIDEQFAALPRPTVDQ